MNNREEAMSKFAGELAQLSTDSPKLFGWVLEVLDKHTPEQFWWGPASMSGKTHDVEDGGNIRHVKKAISWGLTLIERLELDEVEARLLRAKMIAALLLHDLWKLGRWTVSRDRISWGKHSDPDHGVELAKQLKEEMSPDDAVVEAIGCHMGKWTKDKRFFPSIDQELVELVQLADYCSTRRIA